MKKAFWIWVVLMVFSLTALFSACNKKQDEPSKQTISTGEGELLGGYTAESAVAGDLTEEERTVFAEAIEDLDGIAYTPLTCFGYQSAGGSRYAFMITEKATVQNARNKLAVAVVYKGIGEKAVLEKIQNFILTDYTGKGTEFTLPEKPEIPVLGGWVVSVNGGMSMMPERLASATSGAFISFDKVSLRPLCCLGTKVVAGTDYAMLCTETDQDANTLYIVEIFDGVNEEHATVLSVCPFNLVEFMAD